MNPTRLLLALIAIALVLSATPLAAAQQTPVQGQTPATNIALAITPPDSPIKPLSGVTSINIAGTVSAAAGVSVQTLQLNFKVDSAPPWAAVSISPATQFVPIQPGGANTVVTANIPSTKILVSTTADAPAFTPAEIKITVSTPGGGNAGPGTTTETTLISADYFSIIDASAAQTIQIARPQTQVAYPITVTNFGNANTKVFFEITNRPDGWNVQEPIPVTLEARQQGGKLTSQTVNLNILTPYHNGYLNEVGSVTMKITSNYALDSKLKGDTTIVSVLTTDRGFYVPGAGLFAILGAVGVLALLVRRRA